MNRASIFKEVQNSLIGLKNITDFEILEDQLIINLLVNGVKCKSEIRCQNFGKVYLMNLPVNMIKIDSLESEFESLLFDDLKKYYNNNFTLSVGSTSLNTNSAFTEYRIESEKDLNDYCTKLSNHINELNEFYFSKITHINYLSQYVAKFDYENNLKVLVGGQFPIQTFKKIFLLKKGNQIARYLEYKQGLRKQIESFSIRKPNRKDEAKMFKENYDYIINELDKEDTRI
ncbi:hypothetical protein D9O36_11880 [Zobellia amurskyensis]|uniref:Uncharacterized protein n=1 Tax=Zobellia amurskyensis TaxID=248905 RepID=A0A7X2ZUC3_9FLAO|nr:hypothetical protein [Zobellia amurskyensis]MUH36542.1 hypothetical protein [Zobellia amurskyensis]